VQVLTRDNAAVFLKNAMDLLLPPIDDPTYTCFPFYLPLLERKSVLGATPEALDSWFCGASLYIRESVEDTGLLIASKVPLGPLFRNMRGRPEPEGGQGWLVPCEP